SQTPYPAGQWLLRAAVTDASGNTDTLQWHFTISNVNGIEEVMNYPNPFKDKTDFTFILKSDAAADMKIIVYTIAGRKIRTLLPTDLHAGFNMIEWDGRDDNGNEVADGTYLYRVVINGKNGDNVSDAVTERAVRDR
ncbi:MAG: FlgD immunoglobulin-like domain containing protein, partial [Candidatus Kapaibacterium sp.]